MYNLIKESNAVRDGFYQEVADVVSASVTRGNVIDEGTGTRSASSQDCGEERPSEGIWSGRLAKGY